MKYWNYIFLMIAFCTFSLKAQAENWVNTNNVFGSPVMIDLDSLTPIGDNMFYFVKYRDIGKGMLVESIQYQKDTDRIGVIESCIAHEFYKNRDTKYRYLGTRESKSLKKVNFSSQLYNSIRMAVGVSKPQYLIVDDVFKVHIVYPDIQVDYDK